MANDQSQLNIWNNMRFAAQETWLWSESGSPWLCWWNGSQIVFPRLTVPEKGSALDEHVQNQVINFALCTVAHKLAGVYYEFAKFAFISFMVNAPPISESSLSCQKSLWKRSSAHFPIIATASKPTNAPKPIEVKDIWPSKLSRVNCWATFKFTYKIICSSLLQTACQNAGKLRFDYEMTTPAKIRTLLMSVLFHPTHGYFVWPLSRCLLCSGRKRWAPTLHSEKPRGLPELWTKFELCVFCLWSNYVMLISWVATHWI